MILFKVYERLDDLGADTAEARASHLLRNETNSKKCLNYEVFDS